MELQEPQPVAAPPSMPSTAYPPYPEFEDGGPPPSVANAITKGRDLRVKYKSKTKRIPVLPPPRPARPKPGGPMLFYPKLTGRALQAYRMCMRRNTPCITNRVEWLSNPTKRGLLALWREYADKFPAETIHRIRLMLNVNEPFGPDEAYEFFMRIRKEKRRLANLRCKCKKTLEMNCNDKRYLWARDATVSFAKGIQKRLAKPTDFALNDSMLRLSNIVLDELCSIMKMRMPSRRSRNPKAKFMTEVADKVAVWMDEILTDSDDRMLMMDFDEDDDVLQADAGGDGYDDDFLDMMGGGGLLTGPKHAYLKFSGKMLEAFLILTEAMNRKGSENLITHGKIAQTYREAADDLKKAPSFDASDYPLELTKQLTESLKETVNADTPDELQPEMAKMVDICSKYLAQNAEYNKEKGPAFELLVKALKANPTTPLFATGKVKKTQGMAAKDLEEAKGLDSDHDDPNLSQEIHKALSQVVAGITPADLKADMAETIDLASKYLSQVAVDEAERGPAFDLLLKTLNRNPENTFTAQYPVLTENFGVAYVLENAPGFSSTKPDPATAPLFSDALHKAIDPSTPSEMKADMKDIIDRSANYLSGFARDRDKMTKALLKMMNSKNKNELDKHGDYAMSYRTGAFETATSPMLVPYRPVKEIAEAGRKNLQKDMEAMTSPEDKAAMNTLLKDVGGHLSQPITMRSGVGGERYPVELLSAVMDSLGNKPLFKHKAYGHSFRDSADMLKYAGELETDPKAEALRGEIYNTLDAGVRQRLPNTVVEDIKPTLEKASKHLAKMGMEKGNALGYLVEKMKKKGNEPLAKMQGYQQTYNDAAQRLEVAPSLRNDKVDKAAYEGVRSKLQKLIEDHPSSEHAKHMPDIIEEASKFLAQTAPTEQAEKRKMLGDFMKQKKMDLIGAHQAYKMTYHEGADELQKAPMGVTTPQYSSPEMHKEILKNIGKSIPNAELAENLKEQQKEGAAHVSDVVHGRGEAMKIIGESLKKKGNEAYINLGKYEKSHQEAARLIENAPHFHAPNAHEGLVQANKARLQALDKSGASEVAKKFMPEAELIASQYLAHKFAQDTGLGHEELNALAAKAYEQATGVSASGMAGGPGDGGTGGAGGPGGSIGPGKTGGPGSPGWTGGPGVAGAPGSPGWTGGPGGAGGPGSAGWTGKPGGTGGPGSPGWTGKPGSAGGPGSPGWTGGPGGAGGPGSPGWTGGPGAAGGPGSPGWTGGPGSSGGPGTPGWTGGPSAAGGPGSPGWTGGAGGPGTPGWTGGPGGAGGPGTPGWTGGPGGAGGPGSPGWTGKSGGAGGPGSPGWTGRPGGTAGPGSTGRAGGPGSTEGSQGKGMGGVDSSGGGAGKYGGVSGAEAMDREKTNASGILVNQLRARGKEVFYEQPQKKLTHEEAANTLSIKPPLPVEPSVKSSADTARLHNKFERKLTAIVGKATPKPLEDTMQDVVIESARILAERFVSDNYKALVHNALISEMQRKGSELLIEKDGVPENFFYAAQRLKKAKSFEPGNIAPQVAFYLKKKIEEGTRHRAIPRRLAGSMKEKVMAAADYLSDKVTKPEPDIDAYVTMLAEMEAKGDEPLVRGTVDMSYKDAAAYLRQLPTYEDRINRPDHGLTSSISNALHGITDRVPPKGYAKKDMDDVINKNTKLLVSYIKLQQEKTKALKHMIDKMKENGDRIILRHSTVKKTFDDGVNMLDGKKYDQITSVSNADPVVSRKIDIKLTDLMENITPAEFSPVMDEVVQDATKYLAVMFFQPQLIQVCKCMQNVYVQCEIWCEETLRHVAAPCCSCSRVLSTVPLADLSPDHPLETVRPDLAIAPHKEIHIVPCDNPKDCNQCANKTSCDHYRKCSLCDDRQHTVPCDNRRSCELCSDTSGRTYSSPSTPSTSSTMRAPQKTRGGEQTALFLQTQVQPPKQAGSGHRRRSRSPASVVSSYSYNTGGIVATDQMKEWHSMMSSLVWNVQGWRDWLQAKLDLAIYNSPAYTLEEADQQWAKMRREVTTESLQWRQYNIFSRNLLTRLMLRYRDKLIVSPTRASPKTKEYMSCQQEIMRGIEELTRWTKWLVYLVRDADSHKMLQRSPSITDSSASSSVSKFSRAEPEERPTVVTDPRWAYFKEKAEEAMADWIKYNVQLDLCWEKRLSGLIPGAVCNFGAGGAAAGSRGVWIVSALGAVPRGAVSAGAAGGERAFVARTVHAGAPRPAALLPSRHAALLYADSRQVTCTKYQVLCNADVSWAAWTSGSVHPDAIDVARGVYIGRIFYKNSHYLGPVLAPSYRCHVVIHDRPFAFAHFELLIAKGSE